MTALLILAALSVMCSLASTVSVALIFRQTLRETSRANERDSIRRDEQLSRLMDRFQAIRWEDLAALRSIQDTTEEGGFLTPAEQAAEAGAVEVEESERWGPLSRLRAITDQEKLEQSLLEEDFPDESRDEVSNENR